MMGTERVSGVLTPTEAVGTATSMTGVLTSAEAAGTATTMTGVLTSAEAAGTTIAMTEANGTEGTAHQTTGEVMRRKVTPETLNRLARNC